VEGGVAAFLLEHRMFVGGLTAFAVAFAYVTANAIWYQPHAHGGAFFPTRPAGELPAMPQPPEQPPNKMAAAKPKPMPERMDIETIIRRQQAAVPAPEAPAGPAETQAAGEAMVEDVQRMLAALDIYDGEVDGISGPQTESAIASYRKMTGLPVSGDIDAALLEKLRSSERAVVPTPLPDEPAPDRMATATTGVAEPDPMVLRIQAGLKAFGNPGIEVDGVVGENTKKAILEFQSLFGLPQTGEPDEALYAKMREIGLTN
jgi:peptidoglycan hydrolase-like protein with peptidoglycan-binding domain